MPLDRSMSVIAVPHPDGGMTASLTMMVYHSPLIPVIEATLENVALADVTPQPADDEMPAWISLLLRKLATQVELAYATPDHRAAPWPEQLILPFED